MQRSVLAPPSRIFRPAGSRKRFVFLPFGLAKITRHPHERERLRRDARNARTAAATQLWHDLVVPCFTLGGLLTLQRRFRPTTPADAPAVFAVVAELLDRAEGFPGRLLADEVTRRPLFRMMEPAVRRRITRTMHGRVVPATGAHGDMHIYNFVGSKAGYRLIDWEHFDPEGSYLYDYCDFHVSARYLEEGQRWPHVLGRLAPDDPVFVRLGDRFGLPPDVVLAYYLYVKADVMASRLPPAAAERDSGIATLLRLIAARLSAA